MPSTRQTTRIRVQTRQHSPNRPNGGHYLDRLLGLANRVVGALVVALLGRRLLEHVPTAALAPVVISSAIGLFEVNDLKGCSKLAVGILAVDGLLCRCRGLWRRSGVGIALVIAVLEFLGPHSTVLGRVDGVRVIMTSRAIPTLDSCLDWCCSAGMRRCSLPTRNCSRTVC